jgi:hypothetical protein
LALEGGESDRAAELLAKTQAAAVGTGDMPIVATIGVVARTSASTPTTSPRRRSCAPPSAATTRRSPRSHRGTARRDAAVARLALDPAGIRPSVACS